MLPEEILYPEHMTPDGVVEYKGLASLYPAWHGSARCLGKSEAVFFGSSEPEVRPQYTLGDIKRARSVCQDCPVARQCMKASLENREEFGVWAGSTSKQRKAMLKRIRSGESTFDEEVERHLEKARGNS